MSFSSFALAVAAMSSGATAPTPPVSAATTAILNTAVATQTAPAARKLNELFTEGNTLQYLSQVGERISGTKVNAIAAIGGTKGDSFILGLNKPGQDGYIALIDYTNLFTNNTFTTLRADNWVTKFVKAMDTLPEAQRTPEKALEQFTNATKDTGVSIFDPENGGLKNPIWKAEVSPEKAVVANLRLDVEKDIRDGEFNKYLSAGLEKIYGTEKVAVGLQDNKVQTVVEVVMNGTTNYLNYGDKGNWAAFTSEIREAITNKTPAETAVKRAMRANGITVIDANHTPVKPAKPSFAFKTNDGRNVAVTFRGGPAPV